jgi:hypothetical protein
MSNFDSFLATFRPRTDAASFAQEVPFNIRAIRSYARKMAQAEITDFQIIYIAWKANLVKKKPEKDALLEDLNETTLYRINRWLGMQVFAAGFDSYWQEARRL